MRPDVELPGGLLDRAVLVRHFDSAEVRRTISTRQRGIIAAARALPLRVSNTRRLSHNAAHVLRSCAPACPGQLHVDQCLMSARIVEAIRDQMLHALPAHVGVIDGPGGC
jgi:hypothetical protein